MIKRILNSQTNSITGAALILGAASFVSRLIGLLRDRVFVHQFGAGDTLDVYYAAFRVPDFVFNLVIVGALSVGFIPVFTKLLLIKKERAWHLTNNIVNILGIILIIISLILFILAPHFMRFLVPGFDPEKIKSVIDLTRIMLLSPILLGLSSVVSAALQSLKSFFIYALTPIMYNIGIIIGALLFVPLWGINGLAYGVVLGAVLHLAIQIPTLVHHGFKYQPILQWKDNNVLEIGRLLIPRTMGLAVGQLNFLVITILASTLTVGSLTIFNLANNLQYFPIGIIGFSFAVAAFPTLSKFVAERKQDELINHLSKTIRQILFFIIPATLVFLLLRAQIVRIVLGSGQFDWDATIATGNTLAFFALSLTAQCMIPLLARGFYALHDTWVPFKIAFVSVLINIIFSLLLKDLLGVSGLALAFSIAATFQATALWITLRKKIGTLRELDILQTVFKISFAAIVMGIVTQLVKTKLGSSMDLTSFWKVATQGFVAGALGLITYIGICFVLKVEELFELIGSFKRKWLKLTNIPVEISEVDDV